MAYISKYDRFESLDIPEKQAFILGLLAYNDYYHDAELYAQRTRSIIEDNPRLQDLDRGPEMFIRAACNVDTGWDNPRDRLNPYEIEVELVADALTYRDQDIDTETIYKAAHFVVDWYPEMIHSAVWTKTICGPTFALLTDQEFEEHIERMTSEATVEQYEEDYGMAIKDAAFEPYNLVMDYC